MTRHEIAVLVWDRMSEFKGQKMTKKMTTKIVKLVFEVIAEALLRGELVSIDKFGLFRPKVYASQKSWSHKQQKMADSRPFMAVRFTMGSTLKNTAKELLVKKGGPDG